LLIAITHAAEPIKSKLQPVQTAYVILSHPASCIGRLAFIIAAVIGILSTILDKIQIK
jgi:hypothetical protein